MFKMMWVRYPVRCRAFFVFCFHGWVSLFRSFVSSCVLKDKDWHLAYCVAHSIRIYLVKALCSVDVTVRILYHRYPADIALNYDLLRHWTLASILVLSHLFQVPFRYSIRATDSSGMSSRHPLPNKLIYALSKSHHQFFLQICPIY